MSTNSFKKTEAVEFLLSLFTDDRTKRNLIAFFENKNIVFVDELKKEPGEADCVFIANELENKLNALKNLKGDIYNTNSFKCYLFFYFCEILRYFGFCEKNNLEELLKTEKVNLQE